MKSLKTFSQFITEEVETVSGTGAVWKKPVEAEITKLIKNGKQNVVQIKSDGKIYNYSIVGIPAFSKEKNDINFQKLEKTVDNGLKLYRYVKNGIDPYTVTYDELKALLPKLAKGSQRELIDGTLGDIYFTKIS